MVRIKQVSSDFLVVEMPLLDEKPNGKYGVFSLEKEGWNTMDAVSKISSFLGIPNKRIGYAGNKDMHAITKQYISVPSNYINRLKKFKNDKLKLKFYCYSDEPIALGMLKGNYFEIIVRDLSEGFEISDNKIRFMNYFDSQRFSDSNHLIGREIVKRNFSNAYELVLNRNYFEKNEMILHLEKNPNDYVGALKILPKGYLLLFIHSYQSELFNRILCKYVRKKFRSDDLIKFDCDLPGIIDKIVFLKQEAEIDKKIPIIGFGYEESDDEELNLVVREVLDDEDINTRDFIINQLPHLSSEGDLRDMFVKAENFSASEAEKDELNEGKFKRKICFELSKGSYATMFIKYLFRTNDI